MRRFYASPQQFRDDGVTLTTEESRHLRNVLRLKAGDLAQIFDGEGREYVGEVIDARAPEAHLRIVREVEPTAPESQLDLVLATAVYKNDKLDLVVQKAVELGVVRLSPIITSRSETSLRDAAKRIDRWRKIALEATKQCERAMLMEVDEPLNVSDYVARLDSNAGELFIFSERSGGGIPTSVGHKKTTALIGPKGGWEDSEINLAIECGFAPVKLGRRIMRAETAAIAFAALLQHRFGDLN